MATAAGLALAGAALAFVTISDNVLEQGGETGEDRPPEHHRNCAVAGAPLHVECVSPEAEESMVGGRQA